MYYIKESKKFTHKGRNNYLTLEHNALIVPETDKTRTEASFPAMLVIVVNDALTMLKVASEIRITATLLSKSISIKLKLVWLAPTSP